jgi:serine protease Do
MGREFKPYRVGLVELTRDGDRRFPKTDTQELFLMFPSRSLRPIAGVVLFAGLCAAQAPAPAPPAPPSPRAFAFRMAGPPATYIGVGFQEIDAERAKALKLPDERGVEVTIVKEGSPAEKAGVLTGDVILEYNGQRVESTDSFLRFVKETPPGRVVKLTVSRAGQTRVIPVATVSRKEAGESEAWRIEMPEFPDVPRTLVPDLPQPTMSWSNRTLGVQAEGIAGEFAEFFGAKQGVLIRAVHKNTPAERAGLKVGDLIIKCNNVPVTSVRQLSAKFREESDKRSYTLTILRNKGEMQIPVVLEPAAESRPRARQASH